jgi:acyl-CoA reductase-like NAD-dependent aldehyde dehydrogenase
MNWNFRVAAIRWNIQPFVDGCIRFSTSVELCRQVARRQCAARCRMRSFKSDEPRGEVGPSHLGTFRVVNAVIMIAPALAAGNTVVLKPSEESRSAALKLAELALQVDLPDGVLSVVPGLGSTVAAALAAHSDVDLLSFTGSTVTSRKILEASSC